jgi:hypothetical protein
LSSPKTKIIEIYFLGDKHDYSNLFRPRNSGELQGVQAVKADQTTRKVEITFDPPASEEKIKTLLAEIDYPVEGLIAL